MQMTLHRMVASFRRADVSTAIPDAGAVPVCVCVVAL